MRSSTYFAFVTLCASAVLMLEAAPGFALPGDPQIEAVSPADGATVAADPDGIVVVYTCPTYRSFESSSGLGTFPCSDPFVGSSYGADFSTSPELGSDGRLRSDLRYSEYSSPGGSSDNTTPAGQRRAVMAQNATTPGRYFSQARRICVDCPTGYETGPVRSFVVRTQASVGLAVQARGYVGYPLTFSVRTKGLEDGAPVVIERRAGARWVRVTGGTVRKNRAATLGLLPKGTQTVRVTALLGDQRFASSSRTVRVKTARKWTTVRAAGRYSGSPEASFRIAPGGRELRAFRASVVTYCVTNTGIGGTTLKGLAAVPRRGSRRTAASTASPRRSAPWRRFRVASKDGGSPAAWSSRSASASAAERSGPDPRRERDRDERWGTAPVTAPTANRGLPVASAVPARPGFGPRRIGPRTP